ncbi:YabP/YqfC family sporulation protein [Pasteuria penetrans]|uniref:YabP/YqfC family sporulation protein n=1 Tax=Pasteuria penetrans TaxID=86005 RepID=UPI000F9BC001|nr:YabP/YqfC family sporulation protein [Pasteuria penetrans]
MVVYGSYREGVGVEVEDTRARKPHEIVITNRGIARVTGVVGVESFDSEGFLLQTDYGYLGIRGQDLQLRGLDLEQGMVEMEGRLLDVSYLDDAPGVVGRGQRGLWGRLFA